MGSQSKTGFPGEKWEPGEPCDCGQDEFYTWQELTPVGDAGRQLNIGVALRAGWDKYCSYWNRFSCPGQRRGTAVPYLVGQEPVKGASFIHMTFLKIVWKRKVLVKSSVCCEKMEGDEEEKSLCSWWQCWWLRDLQDTRSRLWLEEARVQAFSLSPGTV